MFLSNMPGGAGSYEMAQVLSARGVMLRNLLEAPVGIGFGKAAMLDPDRTDAFFPRGYRGASTRLSSQYRIFFKKSSGSSGLPR